MRKGERYITKKKKQMRIKTMKTRRGRLKSSSRLDEAKHKKRGLYTTDPEALSTSKSLPSLVA